MAPLYKVTLERKIDETFYVSAETDDFARDIAMDVLSEKRFSELLECGYLNYLDLDFTVID